jgi:lysophospholipase L1-like esterase
MTKRAPALILLAAVAGACGGSGPGGPDPVPTPTPGTPVTGFVYYDENGNGALDAGESVRLPGVTVAIAGQVGQSASGGRFTVSGVPAGSQSATARPESLPAYFVPGPPVSVAAPQSGGDLAVPATLALAGRATANLYLAFGDSITWGEGSSDGAGYRDYLRNDLRAYWGKADVTLDGLPGSRSNRGESRLGISLNRYHPAYVLILYGTNDWNEAECRNEFPCYTIDALRSMVLQTRDAGAFPVVGTIPPVDPDYVDRDAEARNDWVKRMNDLVRAMAKQEGAPVAEVHGAFLKQPSLPPLFTDFLHPNDTGFQLIGHAFFDAITRPIAASGSGRRPAFFLEPPPAP